MTTQTRSTYICEVLIYLAYIYMKVWQISSKS